jgi:hypothetical protein
MPMSEAQDCVGAFIEAACVPLDGGHASGTLEDAQAILGSHPGLAGQCIHAAAILGDEIAVRDVPYPSGFWEVDALLESHGASRT